MSFLITSSLPYCETWLPKVLDVIVDLKVEVQFERQTGARSDSMRINIKQGPMIRRQIYLSYVFWVQIALLAPSGALIAIPTYY